MLYNIENFINNSNVKVPELTYPTNTFNPSSINNIWFMVIFVVVVIAVFIATLIMSEQQYEYPLLVTGAMILILQYLYSNHIIDNQFNNYIKYKQDMGEFINNTQKIIFDNNVTVRNNLITSLNNEYEEYYNALIPYKNKALELYSRLNILDNLLIEINLANPNQISTHPLVIKFQQLYGVYQNASLYQMPNLITDSALKTNVMNTIMNSLPTLSDINDVINNITNVNTSLLANIPNYLILFNAYKHFTYAKKRHRNAVQHIITGNQKTSTQIESYVIESSIDDNKNVILNVLKDGVAYSYNITKITTKFKITSLMNNVKISGNNLFSTAEGSIHNNQSHATSLQVLSHISSVNNTNATVSGNYKYDLIIIDEYINIVKIVNGFIAEVVQIHPNVQDSLITFTNTFNNIDNVSQLNSMPNVIANSNSYINTPTQNTTTNDTITYNSASAKNNNTIISYIIKSMYLNSNTLVPDNMSISYSLGSSLFGSKYNNYYKKFNYMGNNNLISLTQSTVNGYSTHMMLYNQYSYQQYNKVYTSNISPFNTYVSEDILTVLS